MVTSFEAFSDRVPTFVFLNVYYLIRVSVKESGVRLDTLEKVNKIYYLNSIYKRSDHWK